jgi:maleylacetoacetate isomerase
LCLELKGASYQRVAVDLRAGEQQEAGNRAVNPQGFVPTLVVDGTPLVQSLAIIDYLDATFPDPALVSTDPLVRAGQLARALVIATDIHPLDNLRVLKRLKDQFGADQDARDRWYAHWITEGLTALEAMAADTPTGPFLGGAAPDIADVCLVPQLYNARRNAVPVDAFPRLVAADAAMGELPATRRAHPDAAEP